MKTIQYTIRKIPKALDEKLRIASKETSKSLNTLIIETLEKRFIHPEKRQRCQDLNHFSGSWEDDPEFDKAIELLDNIDDPVWE